MSSSEFIPEIGAVEGATVHPARQVAAGFSWTECPRWHEGTFWFTDMHNTCLKTIDAQGTVSTVLDASPRAADGTHVVLGGFGWLPDGRLIVNSMHEKLVLVWDGDTLEVYADLTELSPNGAINDMVVDADGRAYVTHMGFDLWAGESSVPVPIIVIEPDGAARLVEEIGEFRVPNGIAVSADGTKLYVAQAGGSTVSVVDRAADGSLSNARVFAELPFLPDGICLDAEDAVWAAGSAWGQVGEGFGPVANYLARADANGITDTVTIDPRVGMPIAPVLGGPERRTLYVAVGTEAFDTERSAREGRGTIWTAEVPVGGGTARP